MKRTEKFCLVDRAEKSFPSKFDDKEISGFQYVLMDKKGKYLSLFSKDEPIDSLDEMEVVNVADGFNAKYARTIDLEAEFFGGAPKWKFVAVLD